MASIKFLLGMFPDTRKLEQKWNKLRSDYKAFKDFEESEDLKHYIELENEIKSPEFNLRIKEIKTRKFNQTEEFSKEQEFKRYKKSKSIKSYLKVLNSDKLREYEFIEKSSELQRYRDLSEYIRSNDYIKEKATLSSRDFARSEAGLKEKELKVLSRSPRIKKFLKFERSAGFREYMMVSDSDELKRFRELEKFLNSEEFLKIKNYMALSPKQKFEISDEFKKIKEYDLLKKSDKIIWYFKTKKKYPFKKVEKWELSFEDNFESTKLDTTKWITRYLYGDIQLNKSYVMIDDNHAFNEGKNIEFFDRKLRIITRRERAKSLVWDPERGFYEKEFGFTSDMISSAKSFSQKYGLIEAKVKIAPTEVSQSFSLLSDRILPHVDIFKFEKNRLFGGNFWKNGNDKGIGRSISKASAARFTKDYFIYSLEWLPGKMTWKINDQIFKVQSQGLPEVPMYLMFNASLKEYASDKKLPSTLAIDWVRVYQLKD